MLYQILKTMSKITLNEYINALQEIASQHPSFGKLPIIYSHDDEGNQYQMVNNKPGLFKVNNVEERYPEPTITGKEQKAEEFNCIIIN